MSKYPRRSISEQRGARRMDASRRRGRCGTFVALALVVAVLGGSAALPTTAQAAVAVLAFDGFDKCEIGTTAQMNTWYQNSPYWYTGIYIGGLNRSCPNAGLNASWISTVNSQGWSFLPIWVGLQDPCSSGVGSTFSTDTSTANGQGKTAADNASSTASNLGFDSGAVIYYDLEPYGANASQACIDAAHSFIKGWDERLVTDGYTPAVYGESEVNTSYLSDLHSLTTYPVIDIWGADVTHSTDSVWGLTDVPNSYWNDDHRVHQYKIAQTETYGGVPFTIDVDCSLGQEDKVNTFYSEANFYDTGSTNESNGVSESGDGACH